jgi:hypothetical protein
MNSTSTAVHPLHIGSPGEQLPVVSLAPPMSNFGPVVLPAPLPPEAVPPLDVPPPLAPPLEPVVLVVAVLAVAVALALAESVPNRLPESPSPPEQLVMARPARAHVAGARRIFRMPAQ